MAMRPSIIIVGAGAAGIAAGSRLMENGFDDVIILEAEDRIGGRICSVDVDGSMVDLGAQWVHGEDGNIIYDMVKDYDLLKSSFNNYDENTFFCPSLKNVGDYASDLYQIGLDVLDDRDAALKTNISLGDYFIKEYSTRVTAAYPNDTEVLMYSELISEWFSKFVLCYDSAKSWFDYTTHGVFAFAPYPGNQLLNWKDKGFVTVLDFLMRNVPLGKRIVLNKKVQQILWNVPDRRKAMVECTDGSHYYADHVIVTLSAGALKNQLKSLFSPELPQFKLDAIKALRFGTVNKILLKFPNRWWSSDTKGFSFLWTGKEKRNLGEEFPHTEPSWNGVSWLEEIFGFYVVDSHPNVLLGWVVGRNTSDVELLSDEIVKSGCVYLLRKFVGDAYNIPDPVDILRSKWSTNPHFCGSYTYVSKRMDHSATADNLAKPLAAKNGKQTLMFAGEATSATRYSTVDGAIATGFREAERLINSYK